jgi:hypothetical protein
MQLSFRGTTCGTDTRIDRELSHQAGTPFALRGCGCGEGVGATVPEQIMSTIESVLHVAHCS